MSDIHSNIKRKIPSEAIFDDYKLILKDYVFKLSFIFNDLFSDKFSYISISYPDYDTFFERYDSLIPYYNEICEYLSKSENILKKSNDYFFYDDNGLIHYDDVCEISSLVGEITHLGGILLQIIDFRKEEIMERIMDSPIKWIIDSPNKSFAEAKEKESFELKLKTLTNNSFKDLLMKYASEKELTDPEVYKKSGISRATFHNIINGKNLSTKKERVVSLCIALELALDQTIELIQCAGHSFDPLHNTFDMIITNCIVHKNFDFEHINTILYENNFEPIGTSMQIRDYNKSE